MSHLLVCTRLLLLLLLSMSSSSSLSLSFLFVLRGVYFFYLEIQIYFVCSRTTMRWVSERVGVCEIKRESEGESNKNSPDDLFFIHALIVQIEETALCMNPKQQRSIKYASRMQFKWRGSTHTHTYSEKKIVRTVQTFLITSLSRFKWCKKVWVFFSFLLTLLPLAPEKHSHNRCRALLFVYWFFCCFSYLFGEFQTTLKLHMFPFCFR